MVRRFVGVGNQLNVRTEKAYSLLIHHISGKMIALEPLKLQHSVTLQPRTYAIILQNKFGMKKYKIQIP